MPTYDPRNPQPLFAPGKPALGLRDFTEYHLSSREFTVLYSEFTVLYAETRKVTRDISLFFCNGWRCFTP
jgi:hypothetical protein